MSVLCFISRLQIKRYVLNSPNLPPLTIRIDHKVGYIEAPYFAPPTPLSYGGKSPSSGEGKINQYWSSIGGVLLTMRRSTGHYWQPVLVHSATSTGSFFSSHANDKGPSLRRALHRKEHCIIGEMKQGRSPFARPTSAQWVAEQNGAGARRYSYQGGAKVR